MMLSIHENSKDWFELILDLDLLDKHFKEGQDNNGNKAAPNFYLLYQG